MKNIKSMLFVLILFFAVILSVNAKDEVFKYGWSKEQKSELSYEGIPYNTTIAFDKGYVDSDVYFYDYPATKIQYYNFKGESLASTILKNSVVYAMASIDNNIYAIVYDMEDDLFSLFKFDDKLNKVDEIELPNDIKNNILMMTKSLKTFGINYISTYNDELAFVNPDESKIYIVDKDFTKTTTKDLTENLIKKYYPSVYYGEILFNDLMDDYTQYISIDFKESKLITGGVKSDCLININSLFEDNSRTAPCDTIGTLLLANNNGGKVWSKDFEEYNIIVNARFVDNYIVAIGYSLVKTPLARDALPEFESDILIFDMEGNLVQKVEGEDSRYLLIEPSKDGFTINRTTGTCRDINLNPILPKMSMNYDCEMLLEEYYLPRKITTKIEGKGKIDIVLEARYGDEITFEAHPDNGYVLDSIKITDKDGNVIEYNSNKFTMPASDVLVEVVFLPRNPETRDIAFFTVSILLVVGFITFIVNYKKLKFLK